MRSFMKSLIAVILLVLVSCSTGNRGRKESNTNPESSWSQNMRSLMDTLTELLPLVHRRQEFLKPENRSKIEQATGRISQLSHNIKAKVLPPETDPAIAFMAEQFEQDIQRTQESLNYGQMEYARLSLRNITGYCIACHTRHGDGTKFPANVFNSKISGLTDYEKAEYYTATRQFDMAAQQYQKVLTDPRTDLKPLDWEHSARQALALEVRVRRNPDSALLVVQDILKSPHVSQALKDDATQWQQALNTWSAEEKSTRIRLVKLTPIKQIAWAEDMIRQAKHRQKYPMDRAGDIEYLRASDSLHTVLSHSDLNPKDEVKALYLAGMSTEALRDLSFWTMHETLYEACVQKAPKNPIAKKCYEKLEASLKGSYSGSSGTNVPEEVTKKLRTLKSKLK